MVASTPSPSTLSPPGPDESIVSSILGPLIPLHVFCALLVALRLYTRHVSAINVSWDDVAVFLAWLATTVQLSLFFAAIPHGAGRHNFYIPLESQVKASRLLFLSQLPWGWAVALGKISIALLLLRLKKNSLGWRVFLHGMIMVQLVSALSTNVIQLSRCRPVSAAWRFDTEAAQCLDVKVIYIAIYVNGGIAVATDIMLAVTPLTFLRSIRRSTRERTLIGVLMAMGLLAAAAAFVKMSLARKYGQTGDMLWDSVALVTWSVVESQLGIIAACVPCLKSPSERALRRVGLLSEPPSSYRLSSTGDLELAATASGSQGNIAASEDTKPA